VPGIGLAASGTGNIVPFVVTNSSASTTETASITVTPKAYGCTGAPASFTITVYPNPVVPQITTEAPAALCSNTDFTNFGTSTPAPAGVTYTWSVVNATLWKVGAGNQYSLISFPNPGASQVTLTSSYGTTSCVNSATYNVTVGAGVSQNPVLTYYDGYFVCLDYNVDSYVWGYDDVVTLDSTLIPNVSTQNYYNPSPDFTNKYYWVITTKDGCMQKTYYSTPTPTNVANVTSDGVHMNLFPNPAESQLTITFTGATLAGTEARVFDMAGQQIATLPIVNNKAELTVDNIPSGVYSIGCYKDGVRISSATFVKQ
jgi:hypothetical protein